MRKSTASLAPLPLHALQFMARAEGRLLVPSRPALDIIQLSLSTSGLGACRLFVDGVQLTTGEEAGWAGVARGGGSSSRVSARADPPAWRCFLRPIAAASNGASADAPGVVLRAGFHTINVEIWNSECTRTHASVLPPSANILLSLAPLAVQSRECLPAACRGWVSQRAAA